MIIVIPMAGRGSRFANTGVTTPKPLIDVLGKPMLAWALKSIENTEYSSIVFIVLKEHEEKYKVSEMVKEFVPDPSKIRMTIINEVTEGQLCTVLAAKQWINKDEDMLISSSDTYVFSEIGEHIKQKDPSVKGLISVLNLPGEQWSFAKTGDDGYVNEVAEKVRISDHASTGLYYFSSGKRFVELGEEMIRNQEKSRGEYYVIPVYQKYINKGEKIGLSEAQEMWDMGNPAALQEFLAHFGKE